MVCVVHAVVVTVTVVVAIVLACHFVVFGLAVWVNVIFTPMVITQPLIPGSTVDFIVIVEFFFIEIFFTGGPSVTNIFLTVNNALPTCVAPLKTVICTVLAGHWCVPTAIVHKKSVDGLSVPTPPSLALSFICTFVLAPAVPTPTIVSPLAGTSSAAPTHMARINNRAFMVFLSSSPWGFAALMKRDDQATTVTLRLPCSLISHYEQTAPVQSRIDQMKISYSRKSS